LRAYCILATVFWLFGSADRANAEVLVHAAASLTDVLNEVGVLYEQETGENIVFNFGASNFLARQIQEGAPGDIFFSADELKMDDLEKKGLIRSNTRKSLLSNTLVIVVANDSKAQFSSPGDLLGLKGKIAIAEPQIVPAGIYAKEYLNKIDIWEKLMDRLIPTDNVRAALAAVESGNVDAGIVYKTDAQISKRVRIAYEVPRADGPRISYPVAVLTQAKDFSAAKRFYDFLLSQEALKMYTKYGFLLTAEYR
jgi:molybdate transport system substrate-binding protein